MVLMKRVYNVLGLGPDAQSSNYQRNPVTSMMPYITGKYQFQ